MIRLSSFPFKTEKFAPKVSDNKSTSLLLQAWFIRQTMAWVYSYTTLWLKVLRKIENIVRKHMDNYGANEILMPALSPKELWEKTWRWDGIDVMFHLPATENKEYWLNSTHEEVVTPLMKEFLTSYKDLPVCVYQIQDKFRNEKRAKSGLLRWREFWMKDAYSFHLSDEDFVKYYEWMKKVYMDIFDELGIWKDTYITLADGGTFTDKYSHEFQTLLDIGEDTIYICEDCGTSHNEEIIDPKNFVCTNCKWTKCRVEKASEVGNIFPLETKFTKPFGLTVLDENQRQKEVIMWCYGIWISRLMWVIAEYSMKDEKIIWPISVAPANYYIIVVWEQNLERAEKIAKKLEADNQEVILDDRMGKKIGFGVKIKDAELLGIPNIIVVSDKTKDKEEGYEIIR